MKVIGFSSFTMDGLTKQVNKFLAESGVKVVDIKHGLSTSECTALIMYEGNPRTPHPMED